MKSKMAAEQVLKRFSSQNKKEDAFKDNSGHIIQLVTD
jgi:hypothetical protein